MPDEKRKLIFVRHVKCFAGKRKVSFHVCSSLISYSLSFLKLKRFLRTDKPLKKSISEVPGIKTWGQGQAVTSSQVYSAIQPRNKSEIKKTSLSPSFMFIYYNLELQRFHFVTVCVDSWWSWLTLLLVECCSNFQLCNNNYMRRVFLSFPLQVYSKKGRRLVRGWGRGYGPNKLGQRAHWGARCPTASTWNLRSA